MPRTIGDVVLFGPKTLPEICAELREKGFDLKALSEEFRRHREQPRNQVTDAELEAKIQDLMEVFEKLQSSKKSP